MLVDFTVPIYTAIGQLTSFTLGYKPQLVVSNVGIDPTTVGGLLKTISKGKASGTALIEGAITDGYLPSVDDTSNPWIAAVQEDPRPVRRERAVRRQRRVRDGQRLHARAGAQGGRQEPDPPGPGQRDQQRRRQVDRPGLVPFRYSKTEHGGYGGAEIGQIRNGKIVLFGGPLTTDPSTTGAITKFTGSQAAPPSGGVP